MVLMLMCYDCIYLLFLVTIKCTQRSSVIEDMQNNENGWLHTWGSTSSTNSSRLTPPQCARFVREPSQLTINLFTNRDLFTVTYCIPDGLRRTAKSKNRKQISKKWKQKNTAKQHAKKRKKEPGDTQQYSTRK